MDFYNSLFSLLLLQKNQTKSQWFMYACIRDGECVFGGCIHAFIAVWLKEHKHLLQP